MRSALALFLTLVLLWAGFAQLNHTLARWHIFLFAGGLFVTQAALELKLRPGFAAVLAGGLLCDANAPVPVGTFTLTFAITFVALYALRDRLPYDETIGQIAIALTANFVLFFALTFLTLHHVTRSAWPRLVVDLLLSQVFLGLIAPWFFALQERTVGWAVTVAGPLFND